MGGEKVPRAVLNSLVRGSPPHGRGKVNQNRGRDIKSGITPAWAGKSSAPP